MTEPWATPYVELHCHSAFSLCDGASMPEELLARAAALGMTALALTDHNALYGAVPFVQAAQSYGIQPLLGAELSMADGSHLTLLVQDAAGWRNLCTLISSAQAAAPKGQAALEWEILARHTEGLVCLTGCRRGPLAAALQRWDRTSAYRAASWLRDHFGVGQTWVELQHHLHPGDDLLVQDLIALAQHLGLGYVVTNNVHYARRDQQPLHDLLTAIRSRTPLESAGLRLRANSEYYLKQGGRLLPLFRAHPQALTASLKIAERCTFQLQYGLHDLPAFPLPPGCTTEGYLSQLCARALPLRYPGIAERVRQQLAHELRVITRAGMGNYMLIVWDMVQFARAQGIRCQGRGSAANSLVAFLLGISPIDPLAHDLVFERFLSDERPALPDIDLDIAADRRDELIQYVVQRYGPQHAALACTFSTFQQRSALRDVAAALDLPLDQLLATEGSRPSATQTLAHQLIDQLTSLPRHVGQHSGGMVLTRAPLAQRLPTEPAAMASRTVVQWDKQALETVGLVKIDLLGLRMLAALSEAEQLLATPATSVELDQLTFDDPLVYELIARADTIGVFQVESRAQAQILPRFQPRCFADLIVAISLIRPGPIQGEMVHPYLRRRMGIEPVSYLHPTLEPALRETLGVILFQEQVLKVARDVAGFTPGAGEQLRRALGSGRGAAALDPFRLAFLAGALARGIAEPLATVIFEKLRAFGGYSFPKSHAAAFAVIVYQSAWLKQYHPAAFLTALLNNQPMGFWPPAVLVRDARRRGVIVQPLDIQISAARCTLAQGAVRLGLNYVSRLGAEGVQRIMAARAAQPFTDLRDCCRRTRLPRSMIEQLILAGAFDAWGIERRALLWQFGTLEYTADTMDLVAEDDGSAPPPLAEWEAADLQARLLGVTTGDHPLARWRAILDARGVQSSRSLLDCPDGMRVTLIGTVVVHQAPPTAKGVRFITLEDEFGLSNVIVQPWLAGRLTATYGTFEVLGIVQRASGVTNIVATKITVLGSGAKAGP